MSVRIRMLLGSALCGSALVAAGCTVAVSDPSETWPEVEQVQLAVNDMTIKVRRTGGVSGPVPVLRVGENPVIATAFRQYYGGQEHVVQAPRFALQILPTRFVPLRFSADSVNTLRGVLVASDTLTNGYVRLQLLEPSTGRIHFGPVTFPVAIIDY